MKRTAVLIIAFALVQLVCLSLWAASPSVAKSFNIGSRTANSMDIQFKVPEFELEKEIISGKIYDRITVDGCGYLMDSGLPELPVISTMIAIPLRGQASVEVISTRTKHIKHIIPYPSQDGNIDNTPKGFSINQACYEGTQIYPQEIIKYSDPQILRDFRVITIQVQPFAWNPVTQELEVREDVELRVRFNNEPGINEMEGPQYVSSSFEHIYEANILNFGDYRSAMVANTPPRYLVIYGANSDTNYLNKINDWAFWKKQKGADVRMVSTAVAGTTTSAIKSFIQNIYNDINARPDYIVLIGDVTGSYPIPTFTETWSGLSGHGDYPYQQLAGGTNDYLGDIFLGRISAENINQLDVMLSKTYFYEKNVNVNTAQWLNKMLLVGDTNPSGMGCQYTMKNIKDVSLHYNPDYTYTELYGDPSASGMDSAINQGVGFFWYRGWIGISGWSPSSSLVNGTKLPHAIVVTCGTNNFSSGEGTMEKFVRSIGTAAVPAGAVTAIGMETSHTNPLCNNALEIGMAAGIFVHGMRSMGEAQLNGKLFLSMMYGQNHSVPVNYSNHWNNLMGDPTMEVFTGIPSTFSSTAPDSLPYGSTNLELNVLNQNGVPVENACVTISQGNIVLARTYTNALGAAYLFVSTALNTGSAVVTISKHDYKPLQKTVNVYGSGSLVTGLTMIDDDNVGNSNGNSNSAANSGESLEILFSVKNTTQAMINSVSGTISSTNPYVTITSNAVNFASVDVGSSNYSLIPVVVQIAPSCPNNSIIRFDMQLTSGDTVSYNFPSYINVTDAYMNFVAYQVNDTNNQALDPNESAAFTVTVKNNGTVPISDIYAMLITQNDLVQVVDNTAYFGNIMVGTQITCSADSFRIAGRPQLLPGAQIPMRLKLYNSNGFLQWVDFILNVGVVVSTNPLGPDAYGYVMYDITDTAYEDSPTYQWVGIAPAEGGQGTLLSFSDNSVDGEGDAVGAISTLPVTLPFSFRFYGQSYSSITVSSNGFMTFMPTENGNWRNCPVPGYGAPSPLIAPFWDDLLTGSGGVYYWNDAINHRFIVEWYNMKNGYNQSSIETFQVILYNQDYYTTSLGDGPIKIQYHTFNNVDIGGTDVSGAGNYATIGIQNLDQTIGLQYSFNNQYPTACAPLSSQKAIFITNAPIYHYTPHLMYDSAFVTDNNNNVLEPNETANLFVKLYNIGEQTATNITTSISSTSPYVTVLDNSSAYPAIHGDSLGVNVVPFRIFISADCPDNQQLPFVITINTDTNNWQRTFNLVVEKPSMGFHSYYINDVLGNNNGVADPGETVTLVVNARNTSMVETHNLSGMLTTSYVGVTVNNPIINRPIIGGGEILQFAYSVTVDTVVALGANVPLTFNLISSDAPTVNQNWTMAFGTSGQIIDFEATNGYFDAASGWTYGSTALTTPHSGSNLWATNLTGQYPNNAMFILKSPAVTLGANATLTFWHYLQCQNYYDGGNVSISTDGGSSWALLYPVGGYNTSFSIYSLGEPGYTNQISWALATFNLSQYEGSTVILRWRFGSNASVQNTGWFVDDVMISGYFLTPGLLTGTAILSNQADPSSIKLITNNKYVSSPDSTGAFKMYLPQGTYNLTASQPYYVAAQTPDFVLNNSQSSYSYNFCLDFLANPSGLQYTLSAQDSILHLNWTAPEGTTLNVLGYKVYKQYQNDPYQMVAQTLDTSFSEQLYQSGVYHYYVTALYSQGEGIQSDSIRVVFTTSNENEVQLIPVNSLNPNYPNPFNPVTNIAFSTAKAGDVYLRIYNTKGQLVRTLVNSAKAAGKYKAVWDGCNDERKPVSSGLYFYRLDAPGYTKTMKMMLLK